MRRWGGAGIQKFCIIYFLAKLFIEADGMGLRIHLNAGPGHRASISRISALPTPCWRHAAATAT